jgi:hypothetical protein
MQIYSLLLNNYTNARNSYINLGINTYLFTEPFPKIIYDNNLNKSLASWSVWDSIEINGPLTFKELLNYLFDNYSLKIEKIIVEYKKIIKLDEITEEV